MNQKPEIAIVGLGYVGVTLAVTLADRGFPVWGYDHNQEVVKKLRQGKSHLFEPGVEELLQLHLGVRLSVHDHLPDHFSGILILCVSTPVSSSKAADLSHLQAATEAAAECMTDGALVILRSTVPIGTCRELVLPILRSRHREVRLAFCPERTIQGRALEELRELPQVVGALDEASAEHAVELWKQVTPRVIRVSSLEAAEMVKLANNCHTDVLYSFGNEIALMACRLGLDPMEIIQASNAGYPRPQLARPGFVAGPCMSKDPYLLISTLKETGYDPQLLLAARRLNERLPEEVGRHFIENLRKCTGELQDAKVLICGFAYKGWPVTDDVRGTPVNSILSILRQHPLRLYGHDYLVSPETIKTYGASPILEIDSGFDGARGVLFVNEHPEYSKLQMAELAKRMQRPALVYDCWRMLDKQFAQTIQGITYAGIGYG